MDETNSGTQNTIEPISSILPFLPAENRLRIFNMPAVRFIGKSMRDRLYSDPSPIPAFWTEFFTSGHHHVTDALPHVIPNRVAYFFDYSEDTQEYTYMICTACPAGTPVPDGFDFQDMPAAFVCHGVTNETAADPYAEEWLREELYKRGFTLLFPFCEFYRDLEKSHFCVLFACQPA